MAATRVIRAGNTNDPLAREIVITPSSNGCRNTSSVFWGNSPHDGKRYRRPADIRGYGVMSFHAHAIAGTLSLNRQAGAEVTFGGRFPRVIGDTR